MPFFRSARTFVRLFVQKPSFTWDLSQVRLEQILGFSIYPVSARRIATRVFEVRRTKAAPNTLTAYGNYLLDDRAIGETPSVFSIGVGGDISFDVALLDRHRPRLFLFDPTSASERYVATQHLPSHAQFERLAVSDYDGELRLFHDDPAADGQTTTSMSIIDRGFGVGSSVVECRRVSTLMKRHGIDTLDILKLDIEGSGITVLKDTFRSGIYPRQIAAEFERPQGHRDVVRYLRELKTLFDDLDAAGYKIYRTRTDTKGFQVEILAVRAD